MLWLILALLASFAQAAIPLVQEKCKVETLPLVFWMRVMIAAALLPLVVFGTGFPDAPMFYVMVFISAIIFAISDIIYFTQVKVYGAGMISRILPVASVISFVVWFAFDTALFVQYRAQTLPFMGLLACVALAAFCAVMLKNSAVSWAALRSVWFVIAAAVAAPILNKFIVGKAEFHEGPYALALFECFFVASFYAVYSAVRPVAFKAYTVSPRILQAAACIALAWVTQHVLKSYAYQLIDNPGFVVVILFLDAVWITALGYALKKRETVDVFWSFGLVVSAILLMTLKALYFQ